MLVARIEELVSKPIAKKVFSWLFTTFLFFTAAALVLNVFMSKGFIDDSNQNTLAKTLAYKADRPWVFRVLMPMVINFSCRKVSTIIPENVKRSILTNSKIRNRLDNMGKRFGWKEQPGRKYYLTMYFLLWVVLVLTLFALQYLTREVYNCTFLQSVAGPVIGMLCYPLFFVGGGTLYDFADLFLIILCLVFLIKEKWIFYYLFFVIAILNKETNVLLLLFYWAYYFQKHDRQKIFFHTLVHLVLGLPVFVGLKLIFQANPGPNLPFHLFLNLPFFLKLKSYFLFNDIYAPLVPSPRGFNILSVFMFVFLIFYKWKEKPKGIRNIFSIIFILYMGLLVFFGNRDEIRIFTPVLPTLYLLCFYTVINLNLQQKPDYGQGNKR
ncbi:hypothetical protein ACFLZV_02215 [Candidatus Margulisiibacteriota bacterium]